MSAFARLVPNSSPIPPINYYALDLEKSELERALTELNASQVGAELKGRVATVGLCGTYEDGLKFIEDGGLEARTQLERIGTSSIPRYSMEHGRVGSFSSATSSHCDTTEEMDAATPRPSSEPRSPLHILFIGSSLGNFPRGEDATFLESLPLRPGSGDTLLLGMDHGNDARQIEAAYNDSKGITRKFVMNGLASAGRILGDKYLFDEDKWQYIGKYNKELRKCTAKLCVVKDADRYPQAATRRTTSRLATKRSSIPRRRCTSPSSRTNLFTSPFQIRYGVHLRPTV